jgi:hypothetical protein
MDTKVCEKAKPKLKRLTEKRDLISLSNINYWCREMSIAFDKDVLNQDVESNKTLHWLNNAYPLILAYQGKIEESEFFLKKVISYWSQEYFANKNNKILIGLIDPTINLLRLYKLTKNNKGFIDLFNTINIIDINSEIRLGNITVSEKVLGKQWNTLYVATLDELLKSYLLASRFDDVLQLQNNILDRYKEKDVYVEPKIVALISLGKFEDAIKLCWRAINKSTCIKSAVYTYRLYEAFRGIGQESKAKTVMKHLILNMEKTQLDSLSKLTLASTIIEESKLSADSILVKNTLSQYIAIKDEFNYGITLCNLQSNYPSKEQEKLLIGLYKKTDYKVLKNKIEIELKINNKNIWLVKISESLNKITTGT